LIYLNLNYFVTQSGRSRDPLFPDPWYVALNVGQQIIVRRQAITVLNASFHFGVPLTAGALRPHS